MGQEHPASQSDTSWLGAGSTSEKGEIVATVIPSETRDGRPIDHEFWVDEAIRVMSSVFGAATAVPGRGGWADKDQGGKVQIEAVSVVFSLIAKEDWIEENVLQFRQFLHRMGRETEQGEVGVYVMKRYVPIWRFDHE